jgi:hypothetical protein
MQLMFIWIIYEHRPHWHHHNQKSFQRNKVDGQKGGVGKAGRQHFRKQTDAKVDCKLKIINKKWDFLK